jgi:hypothetical protein
VSTYNRDDVTKIVTSFDIPRDEQAVSELDDGDEVIAFLRVYDLAFDEKASSAKFSYEGRHITVDIGGTSIGSDTVRRRSLSIDGLYKIRMSITPHVTPSGKETMKYKILEVIDFTPARQQTSLPF